MIRIMNVNMNNAEHDIACLARYSRPVIASSRVLASNFVPGKDDVICSRGKEAMVHEGNKAFKRIISKHLEAYSKATSKMDKSVIVSAIIDQIRGASPNGGFVRKEKGQWVEVGDSVAREKVGQTMRDMLHSKYKSSTKSKKSRRKEIQAKQNDEIDDFMALNCPDITERVKQLSLTAKTEDELQAAFNQANCELLEALKKARKERTMTMETFANSRETSDPNDLSKNSTSDKTNEKAQLAKGRSQVIRHTSLNDAVDEFHLAYHRL